MVFTCILFLNYKEMFFVFQVSFKFGLFEVYIFSSFSPANSVGQSVLIMV